MKKTLILIIAILLYGIIYAQVGINTPTPTATLDIRGLNKPTSIDGLIAPRISRTDLTGKGDSLYGSPQNGALIYITDTSGGDNNGQRVNITSVGYYYFDSVQNKWILVNTGQLKNQEPWYNVANNQPATSNADNIYQSGVVGVGLIPDFTYTSKSKLRVDDGLLFGNWNSSSNQHYSISQSPSSYTDLSKEKAFTLIAGNSFLGRNEILVGGSTNRDTEAAVQNIIFYTTPTKNTILGTERMRIENEGRVGIGTNSPRTQLDINGAIKIATEYSSSTITNDATFPVPNGGAGTIVFQNTHFFGWNGTVWKQFDN